MSVDLFHKPTQCEEIYDFIKSKGRVLTNELNHFADIVHINNPGGRARELKAISLRGCLERIEEVRQ